MLWQLLDREIETNKHNKTTDQVVADSTKVSLEIFTGNEKLSKQMKTISDGITKNIQTDMTKLGKCVEEAKNGLTLEKIAWINLQKIVAEQ